MKLPKKQAAVVRAALEEWRASGLLDEETGKRLLDDLTPPALRLVQARPLCLVERPYVHTHRRGRPARATNCSLNSSAAFSS